MDTNSLGGGTRESCCSIRSILRGRDAFPFLPFPTRGTSTSSKRNKKWVWFRIRHTFIYACIYTTIKNNQETGQFLISHLEDILTQLCSCIFTFLFGFLWLSNIQKEQAVIRLLGQQTSEKQKMPCRHILDSAVENTAFPPIFYSLKQLFSQSINPSTIFK